MTARSASDGFGPMRRTSDPNNDGPDNDGDGICDDTAIRTTTTTASSTATDADPFDPNVCEDVDSDGCDDCSVGTDGFGPNPMTTIRINDGPDNDRLNPSICRRC